MYFILKTHNDVWNFIRKYSEANGTVPPTSLVIEKFRDFIPVAGVGAIPGLIATAVTGAFEIGIRQWQRGKEKAA